MQLITDLKKTQTKTLAYFDLSEADLNKSYAPGKWTIREMLHHLTDAETVLYERVRRIISKPDQVIWGFDQNLWARHLEYNTLPLSLNKAVYKSVRENVIFLAEKYYVSHGKHTFVHNETGRRTLKDEFDKIPAHNAQHLSQIESALMMGKNLA